MRRHLVGPKRVGMQSFLYPRSRVWPMGFSWSSFIAQSKMLDVCRTAGLGEDRMLALDLRTPDDVSEAFCLAADDVIHFCKEAEVGRERMRRLDRAFACHGVQKHEQKDIDQVLSGKAIGVELGGGLFLAPASANLGTLLMAIAGLTTSNADVLMTPLEVVAVLGVAQWFCLLKRPLFSVFHKTYDFARAGDQNTRVPAPAEVKREFAMIGALAIYFEADLARAWAPVLPASDASSAYGFGLSVARVPAKEARRVGLLAEKRGFFFRPASDGDDKADVKRAGIQQRLRVKAKDFRTVLALRAQYSAHSGALEAAGVTVMLRWLTRSPARHSVRIAALVDAMAVLGAAARGRSSAPTLRTGVARFGAISVAADLLVRYAYIPSESNPADAPSRGVVAPCAILRGGRPARRRTPAERSREVRLKHHLKSQARLDHRARERRASLLV